METILKYFPDITERQQWQFRQLLPLYQEWNSRINVISRKDIDNIYLHHVLHSLAIAKTATFRAGTSVLDFGTGGGFPGIPLAIMFPDSRFKLIDRTGKKITVVKEVAKAIGLTNVEAQQLSGEEERGQYNYVVSRAVMPLTDMIKIVRKNIAKPQLTAIHNGVKGLSNNGMNAVPNGESALPNNRVNANPYDVNAIPNGVKTLSNGVICLKGGDLTAEVAPYRRIASITDIATLFPDDWFKEKYVIHVPL